jgi:hypothetical protein
MNTLKNLESRDTRQAQESASALHNPLCRLRFGRE